MLPEMVSIQNIIWLAGFLEGEGCFSYQKNRTICVSASSTDKDIIEKTAAIIAARVLGPYYKKDPNCKAIYECSIHGSNAASIMMTIYPLMGFRRKRQIRKCLAFWKTQRTYRILTKQFIEEVLQLRNKGVPIRKIAHEHKTSTSTVWKALRSC